jgi:hypothetical protein
MVMMVSKSSFVGLSHFLSAYFDVTAYVLFVELISNSGHDYIVGDDIRGITAIDLNELSSVAHSRQQIDTLISDLSVRLSTLGYDTEFYTDYTLGKRFQKKVISVACDTITTNNSSKAFVTGDILTVMGRSYLGGLFPSPLAQIPKVLERLKDIELVLLELHLGLYEIHLNLLSRALTNVTQQQTRGQMPLHSLNLGNDIIDSQGADTVVGDAVTLFFQIDNLNGDADFKFSNVDKSVETDLKALMSAIEVERNKEVDLLVKTITPSQPITARDVAFADIPYNITVGSDKVTIANNSVIAVGDFASVGIIFSESGTSTKLPSPLYATSIQTLRLKPSVASFLYTLESVSFNYLLTTALHSVSPTLACLSSVCTR